MTASSSQDGSGRHGRQPLRRTTRAEAAQGRRERRGWRTRKLVMIVAGLPVVVVALAGYAMASPGGRHHQPPPVCASASPTGGQTGTSTSASAGSSAGGAMGGSSPSSTSVPSSASASSTASGSAGGTPTGTASMSNGMPMSNAQWKTRPGRPTKSASGTASGTTSGSATPTSSTTCVSPSATATASTSATATATTTATATASAPAATPNPNCTLVVPADPLSAEGLATPYQFVATDAAMGPCNEANVNQSAFVQASIYDPATGALSVYDPLVVDQGTMPAAQPVVPTLPSDAVVGIWFGFNATNLSLQDSGGSLAAGACVNGLGNSLFTQFAYCNAPAFFTAVNQGIAAGKVKVPAPGMAVDGQPCLTTRDFALIDQDQSDNVTTQYLATADGRTAQDDSANSTALAGAVTLANPSDNALLDDFVDPALHCTPWTEPNLGNGGAPATSLGLDEIQANAFPANPVALVPLNDPMTLVDGAFSQDKTNLYRAGVDQQALPAGTTPQAYCTDMDNIQGTRLQQDVNLLIGQTTPSAAAASNLFTFVAMRLQQSFGNLNCQNFGLTNPVSSLATNGAGVVVAAVFAHRVAPVTPGAGNPAEACASMTDPNAQTACALAAANATTQAGAPTPTTTATPRPSGDMHHNSGHHW
jgi:hypothetical protein